MNYSEEDIAIAADFSKQTVKIFFSHDPMKPIRIALVNNNHKLVNLVHEKQSKQNLVYFTLLYTIHFCGDKLVLDMLKTFYNPHKPLHDINKNHSEVFKYAVHYNRKNIVKHLVEYGADLCVDNDFALVKYCMLGDVSMVQLFINHGTNMYTLNNSPLIYSAGNGHMDVIMLLLNKGLMRRMLDNLPNVSNFDMAMIYASKNNHPDIVSVMLQFGADPAINQSEALINAVNNANASLVELLLEHGADANTHNGYPLAKSADCNYLSIVKILVNHHDLNGKYLCDLDADDSIALRLAAQEGHVDIVKLLISSKISDNIDAPSRCNIHACNNEAYQLAVKYGHEQVAQLLKDS